MGILQRLFPAKTTITSATIRAEIDYSESEITKLNSEVGPKLAAIATMNDSEHVKVEADIAATKRAIARLDARIAHLKNELPAVLTAEKAATKAEADAALIERAEAARKANTIESKKLLTEFDKLAAQIGGVLDKLKLSQVTKSAQLVTDRMTYAAVSTAASMKDISESFKYAGGVMAPTGNTLDQTTGIVMSFAKAGILGSEAGVALRSALVRLVKMPKGGLAALSRIGMNLGDYTSARPVTGKAVVGGLQAGGIDASKIEGQIDRIIRANAGRGPAALGAAITSAVQAHLGDSSAIGADTIAESVNAAITAAGSKIDVMKFFTDLKANFDSGAVNMGDIAQILEARHISLHGIAQG